MIPELGEQFDDDGYRSGCDRSGTPYRYTSEVNLAATAVADRFFVSLEEQMLRRADVPLRGDDPRSQVVSYLTRFHEHSTTRSLSASAD